MSETHKSQEREPDPLDVLIDRVAEAVVNKLEERRKIDAIAQAVLERIQVQPRSDGSAAASDARAKREKEGEG